MIKHNESWVHTDISAVDLVKVNNTLKVKLLNVIDANIAEIKP